MSLPPAWKVKRELSRITKQAKHAVDHLFADRLRQARHDRNLPRLLHETPGALPLTARVAVFVIFQPKGIARSTVLTLDHLAQEGWSVLIVSNAPLSHADRATLAQKSAHVIERPNTGYDFGAYREGWRWLYRDNHPLDRLILMNDSTWFPLRMQDDSLRRMEALDVDLAGHIFKTELSHDPSHDHMESHLLMFGPRALAHPAIRQFWADYLMSDSKDTTIARGEKGITHAALGAGLVVQGLLGREQIMSVLEQLVDQALLDVIRNLALNRAEDCQRRAAWQSRALVGQPWRDDFLAWSAHELANSRQHLLSATFVDPAVRLGGMGFLKKSNDPRFQLARVVVMRETHAGCAVALDPVVAEEVQAKILSCQPPFDGRRDAHKTQKIGGTVTWAPDAS